MPTDTVIVRGRGVMRRMPRSMPAGVTSAFAVAVMLCAGVGAARSQGMPLQGGAPSQGSPSARQACRADYQAVCSGVSPGGGRVLACLKANYSKLSPDCQSALAKQMPPR